MIIVESFSPFISVRCRLLAAPAPTAAPKITDGRACNKHQIQTTAQAPAGAARPLPPPLHLAFILIIWPSITAGRRPEWPGQLLSFVLLPRRPAGVVSVAANGMRKNSDTFRRDAVGLESRPRMPPPPSVCSQEFFSMENNNNNNDDDDDHCH
jgi:hypothetical protein